MYNNKLKIKRALSLLLIISMVIPMMAFNLSVESGAYQEVSNEASWYTWGSIQSCADQSVLEEIYGNPVSAEFVNGEYVITVDNSPNKAYRDRMNILADWSLNARGVLPDGTALQGVYGKAFWEDYNNDTVYTGFFNPLNALNRTSATLNEMVGYYNYVSNTGNTYYTGWSLFNQLVSTDTTGNIASSICQSDVVPGSAALSFKINSEGNCIGEGGQGKFSCGFVQRDSFVNAVGYSNINWLINASCGLSTVDSGLFASFGSVGVKNDGYDYCKVTYNGEKLTTDGIDGWIQLPFTICADGSVEYTLETRRIGGASQSTELGLYALYIIGEGREYCLASNIQMKNDTMLRAYVSYSTPAYNEETSAATASYTITGIGSCNGKQKPENVKSLTKHNWNNGEVINSSCVSDGYMLYTCRNTNCTCTKRVNLPETEKNHSFGEWNVIKDAQCNKRGYRERECGLCGFIEKENITALSHEYSDWYALSEPTCTSPGVNEKKCINCGNTVVKNIDSNGHTYGEWTVSVEPTETEDGLMERLCTVCGYAENRPAPATSFPRADVCNYTLEVFDSEGLNYIRIASGVYTTAKDIKAAPGMISLNATYISSHRTDGAVTYELKNTGTYSLWLRYDDGKEYIKIVECSRMYQTVSVNGVTVTVNNLGDVSDFFLATGHCTSYNEVKSNTVTRVTSAKIGESHNYKYGAAMPGAGEYTCYIRYKDSQREPKTIYFSCITESPAFIADGLQLNITDTSNVRVIRMAPGSYSTAGEVKKAPGCRSFSANTVKGADSYTIQNARDAKGTYTVSVDFKSGYNVIYQYDVDMKQPDIQVSGTKITINNIDGLSLIRYAPGVYSTAAEIKAAPGSQYIRYSDTVGDKVELNLIGEYTFFIQYLDNSQTVKTVIAGEQASSFTVSRAFTNDMVVQRDKPFSVWGWAPQSDVNKIVTVYFRGEVAYGVVNKNGEWKATFDKTFSESAIPENITVVANNGASVNIFSGVLTGDVYYVMGQSNVYWPLKQLREDLESQNKTLNCDFSDARNIRLFKNSSVFYVNGTGANALGMSTVYDDVMANTVWMKPSNSEVQQFSAIGYLLAYNLSNCVSTPIGIIEIDASGYPIGAFAPNELCDRWDIDIASPQGIHYYKLGAGASGVTSLQTRFAWNFQLNPLKNFSCAGILWYQGESDFRNTEYHFGKDRYVFETEFVELMNYYRDNFGNSDFPVYIMELPSVYRNSANSNQQYIDTGLVRTEIGTIPTKLENSYVIPCSDLWQQDKASWWNNIHPYCKQEQAIRTCFIICAQKYGILDLNTTAGPQLKCVEYVDACTVKMKFDYVGTGLSYNDVTNTGMLYGLQICTSNTDRMSSWQATAKATITAPDEITISESIPVYGVRYNPGTSSYFPVTCNIMNSAGMPMVAFKDINF